MARLGDVFSLIRNGASIKQVQGAGGIPITRIETISNGEIDRNRFGYAGIISIAKYRSYLLHDGDILMSHINSEKHLGKVALYHKVNDEQIIHGMNLLVLRPNASVIDETYAIYALRSDMFLRQIPPVTKKSVNQASFTVSALKELEIPLPDLPTQRRIAATLDKVSEGIDLCRKMLADLDVLVKSQFVEMFGDKQSGFKYPCSKVQELTDVCSGGTPDRNNAEYWEDGTVPWVKTTELQNNVINTVDEHITEKGLVDSSAKLVPAGTILIAMYGQGKTRGMTAYLGIDASTNQACACILPTKKIDMVFMWQYFVNSYNELRNLAKGSNQANLNAGMIKNFPVPVPPIGLQKHYSAFVEQADKSKIAVQQQLAELETLKKSLMQEYFG